MIQTSDSDREGKQVPGEFLTKISQLKNDENYCFN